MKLKRFSVISVWVAVCLIGLVAIVFLMDGCDPEGKEADARRQRIRELVPIGMDIDEAIELLRAEGFSVGDKYFPTNDKDYLMADIVIRMKENRFDTFKRVIGKGRVKKRYVAIKATPEGVITSILE